MEVDCIIVLANEMDQEGNLNAESVSRIQLACDVYFKNPSAVLITCGWNYRPDCPLHIGEVLKNYAVETGVPAEKIITELNSRDTVGDAVFSKVNCVKGMNRKNLIVVTSDYHVARTTEIFTFIYGPEYTIQVIGSSGFDSFEKQQTEQKSLVAFSKTFQHIQPGDDVAILERLTTQHPFYNGVVHPKIQIQLPSQTA
jgi:uncharacterized SAM-binding protein YcdF (DUF218 family)